MMKYWIAGFAAFTMMTSGAFAQGVMSDTTTTIHSSTAPTAGGTYKSKKTEKVIDSNGVETEKTQTYTNGVGETNASASSRTVAPDGTVLNSHSEDRTVTPDGETTTTSHTTTNRY